MKKKNGFTLVELLIIITLSLTILVLAVISFNRVSKNKKEESWETVKQQVETAAKEYFTSNEYFLTGNNMQGYISVGTLVNQDYLKKVVNPKTEKNVNPCDIIIVSKKEYINEYIYCEKGDDNCYPPELNNKKECYMNEPVAYETPNTVPSTTTNNTKPSIDNGCYSDADLKYIGTKVSEDWYGSAVEVKKDSTTLCTIDESGKDVFCTYDINGKTCKATVNIDKSTPSITIKAYKKTNNGMLDDKSSVKGLKSYTSDEWYNGYAFVNVLYDAGVSGKASFTCSDIRSNKVSYDNFTKYRNIHSEGTTTIDCTLTTNSGKKTKSGYVIKLDRTKPTVSLTMKKKKNGDNLDNNSKISNLENYSKNTWYSGYVFTKISYSDPKATSGSKKIDNSASGIKSYNSEVKGTTKTSGKYAYRNVDLEGETEVIYEVCDNAGNCTTVESGSIKLDRTAPKIDIRDNYKANCKSFKYWDTNNVQYKNTVYITDNISGVKSTDYNYKYSEGWLNGDYGSDTKSKARANTAVLERTSENKLKRIYQSYNFNQNKDSTFKIKACDNADNCTGYETKNYVNKSSSSYSDYCRNVHAPNDDLKKRYLKQCATSSSINCWLEGDCNDSSSSCKKDTN